ncbi:hypothetical protein HPP92_010499 [Vanilla planifolia]|uniref:AB hydrolase-1 domain-containing protein n=1 Tax=Vanilla planifolia TaxID=51239 RepID=A0A835QYR4_VANPL|nr:hypothetical protein HPP92_010499 [Vanilla planifolia]
MPFCELRKETSLEGNGTGTRIFYRRFGYGGTKVLLVIGLAATHEGWWPQIKGLTGVCELHDADNEVPPNNGGDVLDEEGQSGDGIEVCCFDNRGMGQSTIPSNRTEYSTTIMAMDALALLDHLGWKKAHVFGHSMGGMIACKLAAMAPERLLSLALLNSSGGGFECFPKFDRQIVSLAYRFLRAKTPEQRAAVDLETHYTKEYLDERVGACTRRKILYKEYVKAISSSGMQSNRGFEGQVNACWMHKVTKKEFDTIRTAGFPISIIHGRYDVIAQLQYAKRLAQRLQPNARMVELHGGHLVGHERPDEVNAALMELIKASKSKTTKWSNLPMTEPGWTSLRMPMFLSCRNSNGENYLVNTYNFVGKLQPSFVYLIGILLMGLQHMRRAFRILKPVRLTPTCS